MAVGSLPFWIWHADKKAKVEELFLRRQFHVSNRVRSAELLLARDSTGAVFLNGRRLVTKDGRIDVTSHLRLGRNVLAAKTRTAKQPGFIALLVVTLTTGQRDVVLTDREWKTSLTAEPDWTALDFDDTKWPPAKALAPHGAKPWGDVLHRD